jgi:hypothetical protein
MAQINRYKYLIRRLVDIDLRASPQPIQDIKPAVPSRM